ncbi:MAG: hypothetical protein JO287_05485 [Pseudonocardiales bacterium]|nr:hypothetical protein [Pseudonocardiales bacterium]
MVMTDYDGLGTTDRCHPYLPGASEAAGAHRLALRGAVVGPAPASRGW